MHNAHFGVQRLPFTVGFLGSMGGTIYVSMVLHSYLLSVFFSVIQVWLFSHGLTWKQGVSNVGFHLWYQPQMKCQASMGAITGALRMWWFVTCYITHWNCTKQILNDWGRGSNCCLVCIQVLALLYYVISYFPGGSAGLQFITSFVTSTFLKCFKRWREVNFSSGPLVYLLVVFLWKVLLKDMKGCWRCVDYVFRVTHIFLVLITTSLIASF